MVRCNGGIEGKEGRTFVFKVIALAAEEVELLCEDVELLADGVEAVVKPGLAVLLLRGALGGGAGWLEMFVLERERGG